MLAGWGHLLGWTEFGGRVLSLLIGMLAIATTYRLGKTLTDRAVVGLAAAAALGTGVFFVNYLHEMRGYTLYTWLSSMCIWCYWRLLTRRLNLVNQGVFVLSAIALLYTQYFAAITLIGIGVYHLLFASGKKAFPSGRWWRIVWLLVIVWVSVVPDTRRNALFDDSRQYGL
jgi:uncharacterized membrane protein